MKYISTRGDATERSFSEILRSVASPRVLMKKMSMRVTFGCFN